MLLSKKKSKGAVGVKSTAPLLYIYLIADPKPFVNTVSVDNFVKANIS
jgi:hypothetical protein